jgi:hypothetical protein
MTRCLRLETMQSAVEATDHHFIPAAPGYWLLNLVHPRAPDGAFKISRAPIIAWELRPGVDLQNVNFFGHPVTLVWSPYRDAVLAILEPDGVVRLTNGASFHSEAEWLAHAADVARAREEA